MRPATVLRSPFQHRSPLVRQLTAWQPEPDGAETARADVTERLGQWLNVADAIALRSLHQALPSVKVKPRPRGEALPAAAELQDELLRVRQALERAITRHDVDLCEHEFALVHQHVLDLQRHMDMRIDALRDHVRSTLVKVSVPLAQLAALDAALQQLLGGREQHLLSTLPAFLKNRFARLRQTAESAAEPQNPALFAVLNSELHTLLRAELDLRLQPVQALIEAYRQASLSNLSAPGPSAHALAP